MSQTFDPGSGSRDPSSIRQGLLRFPESEDPEVVRAFLTREVMASRLLFCPSINNDMTDDWGMFGYSPGFIFLSARIKDFETTPATELWERGQIDAVIEIGGTLLRAIPHFDFFPKGMFEYSLITSYRSGRSYGALLEALGVTPEMELETQLQDPKMRPLEDLLGLQAGSIEVVE